jgi:hypothetical protein
MPTRARYVWRVQVQLRRVNPDTDAYGDGTVYAYGVWGEWRDLPGWAYRTQAAAWSALEIGSQRNAHRRGRAAVQWRVRRVLCFR